MDPESDPIQLILLWCCNGLCFVALLDQQVGISPTLHNIPLDELVLLVLQSMHSLDPNKLKEKAAKDP